MGLFLLLLTTLIWGTAFLAQKLGAEHLSPLGMTVLRNILGGLFLLGAIGVRRLRRQERAPIGKGSGSSWLAGFWCGIPLFLAMTTQQIGIEHTTPGISAFLTTNYVLIVPVAAALIYRKLPSVAILAAALVALLGTAMICLNGMRDLDRIGRGEAWTVLCAFLFSAQMLIVDHYAGRRDVLIMSCSQLFTAAIVGAPFLLMPSEASRLTAGNLIAGLPALVYLGVFSSGIAYTLQNFAQARVNPSLAAVLLSTESVFGALSGYIVLGDRMSGFQFTGCALVFGAVMISQIPRRGRVAKPDNGIV